MNSLTCANNNHNSSGISCSKQGTKACANCMLVLVSSLLTIYPKPIANVVSTTSTAVKNANQPTGHYTKPAVHMPSPKQPGGPRGRKKGELLIL